MSLFTAVGACQAAPCEELLPLPNVEDELISLHKRAGLSNIPPNNSLLARLSYCVFERLRQRREIVVLAWLERLVDDPAWNGPLQR